MNNHFIEHGSLVKILDAGSPCEFYPDKTSKLFQDE